MSVPTIITNRIATARVVDLIAMGAQSNLQVEVMRLDRILESANEEQCLRTLEKLYRHFAFAPPSKAEERIELNNGYLLAMRGYPVWAIIDAGTNFIRGSVEGHNPDFMPKAAMVGRELARIVDPWRLKLGRARKMADEQRQLDSEAEGYGPLSPELRAKGEAAVSRLRAAALAERQQGQSIIPAYVDPNPITKEALDAAGIPDAPAKTGTFAKLPAIDTFQMQKAS